MKIPVCRADLLHRLQIPGTVWLESGFCPGFPGSGMLFSEPVAVICLHSLTEISAFFRKLETALEQGYHLAGFLDYEAGYGFEPVLSEAAGLSGAPPYGWFGVYRSAERFSPAVVQECFASSGSIGNAAIHSCHFLPVRSAYSGVIGNIRKEIAAGNLYQVNYTGRVHCSLSGGAPELYSLLRRHQPSGYSACINTGERTILSFSPELFFSKTGNRIRTKPMKGTAPRGRSADEDRRLAEQLRHCPKNLAENLMIVDLLRNDLGRICRPGSVTAAPLFAIERYPTLHQMVSTIEGSVDEQISLYALFRALFPSGSITGAPKISAMQLIRQLEAEPRGIYTGTIGYVTPSRDMLFNVAIRTLEVRGTQGVYGTGSGIVWDSDAMAEYDESILKARILSSAATPDFVLFESMLWAGSYLWLEEHLQRLSTSASILGFSYCDRDARKALHALHARLLADGKGGRYKVRLRLQPDGVFQLDHAAVQVAPGLKPIRLLTGGFRVESTNPLLYHKTTSRAVHEQAYAAAIAADCDEVVLLNERHEVTEGAISNIFIRKGGRFYTPPASCGLLDGVFRRYLLRTSIVASERVLFLDDLREADMVYVVNSVRGIRAARLASGVDDGRK